MLCAMGGVRCWAASLGATGWPAGIDYPASKNKLPGAPHSAKDFTLEKRRTSIRLMSYIRYDSDWLVTRNLRDQAPF